MPGKVFSGKQHPKIGTKAIFLCYSLPILSKEKEPKWTTEGGYTQWYLYNLENEGVVTEPTDITSIIRSAPETQRFRSISNETLSEIRQIVEKSIKDSYLKKVQAPVGVKAVLKAWMELS